MTSDNVARLRFGFLSLAGLLLVFCHVLDSVGCGVAASFALVFAEGMRLGQRLTERRVLRMLGEEMARRERQTFRVTVRDA